MKEEEIWKDIDNFDKYQISNLGRVRNRRTLYILKPSITGSGYYKVNIKNNQGKSINCDIHRHLMKTFKPLDDYTGMVVNHIDCNQLNNDLDNLEWCTYSENIKHAHKMNRVDTSKAHLNFGELFGKSGEDAPYVKYSKEIVISIREKYIPGVYGYKQLAKEFNIPRGTIRSIVQRECWKHI